MSYIITTNGYKVLVDEDELSKVSKYKWSVNKNNVVSWQEIDGKRGRSLSNYILGLNNTNLYKTKYYVDGNPLNLQKENIVFTNLKLIDCGEYYKGITPKGEDILFNEHDLYIIKSYPWYVNNDGYAVTNKTYLHRLLLNPSNNKYVDHINHNKLDNRRSNLRIVTPSQNNFNREGAQSNSVSGIRGVHTAGRKGWEVRFQQNGELTRLGYFKDIDEAKSVADEYLRKVKILD